MNTAPRPSGPPAFRLRLGDGRRVLIRPISAADAPRVAAGLARMSERSRYLRFGRPVEALSERHLRYLTDVDQWQHVAWGALALDEPGSPGVAVARFVRLSDDPRTAEVAVTVIDEYQHAGLGRALLDTVLLAALEGGVTRLLAFVLPENEAALGLFTAVGGRITGEDEGMLVTEIPVPPVNRTLMSSAAVLPAFRPDAPLSPAGPTLRLQS